MRIDQTTEHEWQELATQWHSMADQAARMSDDARSMTVRRATRRQVLLFRGLTSIDQRVRNPEAQSRFVTAIPGHLPVTERFTLAPDPRWRTMVDFPAQSRCLLFTASLPKMPSTHDACAHLAWTYRI